MNPADDKEIERCLYDQDWLGLEGYTDRQIMRVIKDNIHQAQRIRALGCTDCGAPEGEECQCAKWEAEWEARINHITGDNDREYDQKKDEGEL